jgi:DNA mismatch endonuclease, patch repair protein
MSRIRARDTKPEMTIRSILHKQGLRFRVAYKTPGGKVDIAFPRSKLAIQIDGCFWHMCPIHCIKPKTNKAFWLPKLLGNRKRDSRQNKELKKSGWEIKRFWEHEVEENPEKVAVKILKMVKRLSTKDRITPR